MIRRAWYSIRWCAGTPPRAVDVLGALATVAILYAAMCVFLAGAPAHGDGASPPQPPSPCGAASGTEAGEGGVTAGPEIAPSPPLPPVARSDTRGRGPGGGAVVGAIPQVGRTTQPTGQIVWAGRAKVTSYGDRWENEVPWDCQGRPLRVGVASTNPEIPLDTILWVQGVPRCLRVRDRGGAVKLRYTSSAENANIDVYTLRPVPTRRGVHYGYVRRPR